MMVCRKYNTVLEEMQSKWAKEQMKGPSQIPKEYLKTYPHSPSGDQVCESIQDSLSKLGAHVQQLCSAVTDLQARSDLQVEVHAPALPRRPHR